MKARGKAFPFGKAFSTMAPSLLGSSKPQATTQVMTEIKLKFRSKSPRALRPRGLSITIWKTESSDEEWHIVSVNSVETFAQLKAKIANKLGPPAAQIQIHSGPDTDMTKVHDDMRVIDIFPQGGTIHIDTSTAASGSSDSQQQGSGNTPESEQISTYTIGG